MEESIEKYFKFSERGTNFSQEMRGGVACFLTMSYILLVNPQVISDVGISPMDIVLSTALSSGIACIVTGLFGNLPFGLAPGIGLSTYLTYGLILGEHLTLTQAYTSCFISGLLLCLFAVTGWTATVMRFIPHSVKVATVIGMGLQIALVGMTSVGLVVGNEYTLVTLGTIYNIRLWLALAGLIMITVLLHRDVPGAILIGIFSVSIVTWSIEGSFPTSLIQIPSIEISSAELVSLESFNLYKMLPAILSFLFIGLVDVSGVVFGMATVAGIAEPSGNIPGSVYAFIGCGVGTMIGALTGSSPVIVYVESAAGIKEGARSGFSAVVTGGLFLTALFLAPLFSQVPETATAPVAILIGVLMMSQAPNIDWRDLRQAVPAFLTLSLIPLTYSITNGIIFGLGSSLVIYVANGDCFRDVLLLYHRYRNEERESVRRSNISMLAGLDDKSELPNATLPTKAVANSRSYGSV